MFLPRSDIAFSADETHRFLPWLLAVMTGLAALLLCLGVTVNSWVADKNMSDTGGFTVTLPADTDDASAKILAMRELLEKTPGLGGIRSLDESEVRESLSRWLGNGDTLEGLPLPLVLDAELDGTTPVDYREVQKRLSAIVPAAQVDAHERWIAAFADISAALQSLISALALLIAAAMAAMIAFTCRASLKLHAKTVHVLHAIGADDAYITRQFKREAFRLTLPAALAGCAAAGLAYWSVGMYMLSLQVSLMPPLSMRAPHFLLLLVLPLACAAAAWGVAHVSVAQQLRHSL